jgi:hypothetical protein
MPLNKNQPKHIFTHIHGVRAPFHALKDLSLYVQDNEYFKKATDRFMKLKIKSRDPTEKLKKVCAVVCISTYNLDMIHTRQTN